MSTGEWGEGKTDPEQHACVCAERGRDPGEAEVGCEEGVMGNEDMSHCGAGRGRWGSPGSSMDSVKPPPPCGVKQLLPWDFCSQAVLLRVLTD